MSQPSKPNEAECRRPDFIGGTPVELADGQEWTLPKPLVRFAPDDSELGFQVRLSLDSDGVFNRLAADLDKAETKGQQWKAELAIARHLLLRNYSLTESQIADLIQFSYDEESDPVGFAIRDSVLGVAFGRGPKQGPPT